MTAQTRTPKKVWYYELQGRPVGPVPESDLKLLAENGTLRPDARVWSEGMRGWEPARAVVPRAFADAETAGGGWGFQHVLAAILATCAAASLVLLGVVAYKGNDPEKKPDETAKTTTPTPVVPGPAPKPPSGTPSVPPGPADPTALYKQAAPSLAVIRSKPGGTAIGSGFVIAPDLVVTTSQLLALELAEAIEVVFPGGGSPAEAAAATIVHEDRGRDLVLLRVGGADPPLKLAAAADPGEPVIVLGGAGADGSPVMARGTIGGREVTRGVPYFKLDVPTVGERQTGGPVFNGRDEVVGVVAAYPAATAAGWAAYAIPASDVAAALKKAAGGDASRAHNAGVVAARQLAACVIADTQARMYTDAVKQGQKAAELRPDQSIRRIQDSTLGEIRLLLKAALPDPVRKAGDVVVLPGGQAVAGRELLVELNKTVATFQELVEEPLKDRNYGTFKDTHQGAWDRMTALCPRVAAAVGMPNRPEGDLSEPVRLAPLPPALGVPEADLVLTVRRVLREVEFDTFAARHAPKK